MVREFAKAVRARGASSKDESSGLATPAPSPRRSPTADEEPVPKAVYLNLEFPVPTREWDGVFDTWIQGDAQLFSEILHAEIEKEAKAKEMAVERKKKRESEAAATLADDELPDLARAQEEKTKKSSIIKRKSDGSLELPVKRRKLPNSPPNTPLSIQRTQRPGESQEKLYLRIPLPFSGLKPEVYIASKPLSRSYSTLTSNDSATPQPNKHTKAHRRAVRQAREAKR
jgi:NAD-dependent histone deacetylase SIR2